MSLNRILGKNIGITSQSNVNTTLKNVVKVVDEIPKAQHSML